MEKLNLSRESLKKFGMTMGITSLVIALLILLRHRHSPATFFVISVVFFAAGLIFPLSLKWVYIFWLRLAYLLAWVNTRLLLFIIFYLLFSPTGLVMRLFKIDFLKRKTDKDKPSYWLKKEDFTDYQRQF